MPKRVIDGKAYNTETAQHVAQAVEELEDDAGDRHQYSYGLYRTEGGVFFLVEEDTLVRITSRSWRSGEPEEIERIVTFHVLSYDQAHNFARGLRTELGGLHFLDGLQVEILADGIFPTVPEAVDEERRGGGGGAGF